MTVSQDSHGRQKPDGRAAVSNEQIGGLPGDPAAAALDHQRLRLLARIHLQAKLPERFDHEPRVITVQHTLQG
jgi:hypothetical protein